MKKLVYNILIMLCTGFLWGACSEDIFNKIQAPEGKPVTLQIPYKEITPRLIQVSRATDAEEKALNNLQVFIFGADKKLKGYKYMTKEELVQDGSRGNISIKTTTGQSYIYAVANVPTSTYKIGDGIPTSKDGAWDEEDVSLGGKSDFTLDNLKDIPFLRGNGINITEANFMMSGSVNDGELCTIAETEEGKASVTDPTEPLIKLKRIVSKVTFTIKAGENSEGITRTFTPTSYEICNIPVEGSLIQGNGGMSGNVSPTNFGKITGDYTAQEMGVFEVYLPENLQNAHIQNRDEIKDWHDREKDNSTATEKNFTCAPPNGTYVVLHGKYTENKAGERRDATVTYYVHLGDFSDNKDFTDFDVERNCHYKYTVTVNGVNQIVVQTEVDKGDPQPGAEGIVFDYTTGKTYEVDSHYGEVDMTFRQSDIQALPDGYVFQIHDINGTSEICHVTEKGLTEEGGLNGANDDWIEFVEKTGNDAVAYPGQKSSKIIKLIPLLQELYKNRNNSSWWENGTKTYTCFINENYYENKNWGTYVNQSPRTLYIANKVNHSKDGRSFHATVAYGISQYSIQTFYNKNRDGQIIAYGTETIRDDNKVTPTNKVEGIGTDSWDGLANMKKDISSNWSRIDYSQFRQACMSRNRDLNGDGVINDNEVRWYVPAIDQYGGLWIGENAIPNTQARLFQGDTKKLSETNYLNRENAEHYYSNTRGARTFWAEEGMATGNDETVQYVRCIRNLQSNKSGTGVEAHTYYSHTGKTIDLSNIDESALRTNYQTSELLSHEERGVNRNLSNPRIKFAYATYNTLGEGILGQGNDNRYNIGTMKMEEAAIDDETFCHKFYKEGGYTWRAPNQRELALMFIIGAYNHQEGCRTHFSNTKLRYSWRTHDKSPILQMTKEREYEIKLRCVRDVE